MPSTCVVNQILLPFVSGFRNYAARMLLYSGTQEKPIQAPCGDVTISCFPKIMDNIDIVEQLARIYKEDFWDKRSESTRKFIQSISTYSCEIIGRLYPILYAEAFKLTSSNFTDSQVANADIRDKRERLINSALKYGV